MNKTKEKALLIGASGQGKVVLDIFQSARTFQEYAFLDDSDSLRGKTILGIPVVGTTQDLERWKTKGFRYAFIAIADNRVRERLQQRAKNAGFSIPTAIHPRSILSRHVQIGEGTAVMAGAVINPNTFIGNGCIINTAASVDHDNRIGDFSQIMPGARLTGTVALGRRVTVGTGAVILPNLTVADDAVIGAGAVVTKDVRTTTPLVGIPARPLLA